MRPHLEEREKESGRMLSCVCARVCAWKRETNSVEVEERNESWSSQYSLDEVGQ